MSVLEIKGPGVQMYNLRDSHVGRFLKAELPTLWMRELQYWMSLQWEEPKLIVGSNARIGENGPTIYEVVKFYKDAAGAHCAVLFDESVEECTFEFASALVVEL